MKQYAFLIFFCISYIKVIPESRIVTVQFQERNVLHGTRTLDNRWIIRLAPQAAVDILVRRGIEVCNRKISVRPYDDILFDEYKEFLEYCQLQKVYMLDKIQSLTGTVPKTACTLIQNVTLEMFPDPERMFIRKSLEVEKLARETKDTKTSQMASMSTVEKLLLKSGTDQVGNCAPTVTVRNIYPPTINSSSPQS